MAKLNPWSDTLDEDHPVTWTPASGDAPRYCTLDEAIRRLAGYGVHPAVAREQLVNLGKSLRTPFAFYQMIDPRETGDAS